MNILFEKSRLPYGLSAPCIYIFKHKVLTIIEIKLVFDILCHLSKKMLIFVKFCSIIVNDYRRTETSRP